MAAKRASTALVLSESPVSPSDCSIVSSTGIAKSFFSMTACSSASRLATRSFFTPLQIAPQSGTSDQPKTLTGVEGGADLSLLP